MRVGMAYSPAYAYGYVLLSRDSFCFCFWKGDLSKGRIRSALLQGRESHTDEGEAPAWWKNTGRTGCSARHTIKKRMDCGQAQYPETRTELQPAPGAV